MMTHKPDKRVLVVEDEDNWQNLIQDLLQEVAEANGWTIQVVIAISLEDALKQIDETLYDCITVDNQLGSGKVARRLLDHIAHLDKRVSVVVVSGAVDPGDVRDYLTDYKIDEFFWKENFHPQKFKQTFSRLFARQGEQEDYVDFEVHIRPDGEVRGRSDQGEWIARITPDVPDDVGLTLELIEEGKTKATLLKNFGKRLYEIIFPSQIHTHFATTEAVAKVTGRRVRIRLTLEADSLARVPWEFVYREEGGYYLAVNPQTVFCRYINLPLPRERVSSWESPLHLLTIIANPSDQAPLNPDEWERIVIDALAMPLKKGTITTGAVKRATYEEIRSALLARKPDIVQFVGHGIYRNGKGYLALVDSDTGKTWTVDDERFANIFLGFEDRLRLVSLATCESAKSDSPQGFLGIAPQIVQRGTPAVVAMQYRVLIPTAKIFLENFYTAVAARKPIDWAVQQARNAISIKKGLDNREFATPVLYMRAKDGNIF